MSLVPIQMDTKTNNVRPVAMVVAAYEAAKEHGLILVVNPNEVEQLVVYAQRTERAKSPNR